MTQQGTLVFFLEEKSAKAMIQGMIHKVLPKGIQCECICFKGKSDLQQQLQRKLSRWNMPHCKFIVLQDQDQNDCKELKRKLRDLCNNADKEYGRELLVRIACRELESFYLGDLQAVENGLGVKGLCKQHENKSQLRNPDQKIGNPSQRLEEITSKTGKKYTKIEGSRAIGKCLCIESNKSKSFQALVAGIQKLFPKPNG